MPKPKRKWREGQRYKDAVYDGSKWVYDNGWASNDDPDTFHARKNREAKKRECPTEPATAYTGTWLPEYVMQLFWDGRLTPRETMLLATIDSLSNDPDKLCFASNQFFMKRLRIRHKTSVTRMISKLKKMKLVIQAKSKDGTRRLKTPWSKRPDWEG